MGRILLKKGNGFQSVNKAKAMKLYLHLNPNAKQVTINRKERIEHNGLLINVAASASSSAIGMYIINYPLEFFKY